jgi:hypothetical protein
MVQGCYAHHGRSDKQHRSSRAVVDGHSCKWVDGWIADSPTLGESNWISDIPPAAALGDFPPRLASQIRSSPTPFGVPRAI